MTCGPAPYMDMVEKEVKALGVTRFFKEKFFTPVADAVNSGLKFTKLQPAQEFYGPVGTALLEAMESNKVPVQAACRAGVCGCCKTKSRVWRLHRHQHHDAKRTGNRRRLRTGVLLPSAG